MGPFTDLDWKPFLSTVLLKLCYFPVWHLNNIHVIKSL